MYSVYLTTITVIQFISFAVQLQSDAQSAENLNRKCHDCEGDWYDKCGVDLQYPGGISCKYAESTQCYVDVLNYGKGKPPTGMEHRFILIVLLLVQT